MMIIVIIVAVVIIKIPFLLYFSDVFYTLWRDKIAEIVLAAPSRPLH